MNVLPIGTYPVNVVDWDRAFTPAPRILARRRRRIETAPDEATAQHRAEQARQVGLLPESEIADALTVWHNLRHKIRGAS